MYSTETFLLGNCNVSCREIIHDNVCTDAVTDANFRIWNKGFKNIL